MRRRRRRRRGKCTQVQGENDFILNGQDAGTKSG